MSSFAKVDVLGANSTSSLARLHQSNVSSVPWNPEQDDALTFLPTTFTDRPPRPLGGQVPELSSSDPVPNTFLGSLTTTLRAMSTKRASRLGGMGKSDVIVYYVSTKKFAKLPRADVPGSLYTYIVPTEV